MFIRLNHCRMVTRRASSLTAALTLLTAAVILVSATSGTAPAGSGQAVTPRAVAAPVPLAESSRQAPATSAAPTSKSQAGDRPTALRRLPAPAVWLPDGGVARLVRREVGPDGTLPIPDGVHNAAWWGADLDARSGTTVLAGHLNWRSTTGPFAELWRARPGEHVEVVNEHGRIRRYKITEIRTLAKDDLPQRAPALFRQDDAHRIVLVTCGGRWIGQASGYESNRIVIAYPI